MRYGSLSIEGKELKQAVLIVSNDELSLLIAACEEYQKTHPRMKKIKILIQELDDIAIF